MFDEENGCKELEDVPDAMEVERKLEEYKEELRALRCPLLLKPREPRYDLRDLLERIIPELHQHDTSFLTHYVNVLRNKNASVVHQVTCDVMSSIEEVLRGATDRATHNVLGMQRFVLVAFLCAACMAVEPRVPRARCALRQLLVHCDTDEAEQLAKLWWRALPTAAPLIHLADTLRAPRRATALEIDAPSPAELMLRAALSHLPPHAQPDWSSGALRLEELEPTLALEDHGLAMCGRILAAAPAAQRVATLSQLATALLPRNSEQVADMKIGVAKLRMLYGAKEKVDKLPEAKVKGKRRKSSASLLITREKSSP